MRIYFIAGEASGDAHGAELIHALCAREPELVVSGAGGAKMHALGGDAMMNWTDEAGVIGFIDVLKKYRYFVRQQRRMLDEIKAQRPDAVVLVDYPGFNLRIAKKIKAQFPEIKIIHYISPQVWAWNRGRIPLMAKFIDLMLCIFPFEKPLYEASGLRTEFVGHPMLDALEKKRIAAPRETNLIGLFPGSREREVKKIFPSLLAAAHLLKARQPALRFEAAAASPAMLALMQSMPGAEICEFGLRNSHELMQRAAAGVVASGTATMEATFFRMPYLLVYRVARVTYALGKWLIRVPWLGMANIIANREVVREFIQDAATPEAIAAEVSRLANDENARAAQVRDLDEVIAKLGATGASERAADAILQLLR